MAKFSGNNVSFAGIPLTSFEVNQSADYFETATWGSAVSHKIKGPTETTVSISFYLDNADLWFPQPGEYLTHLGNGKVCDYCNTYWPDGNFMCWNCGGTLSTVPLVNPVRAGVVTTTNLSAPVHGFCTVNMEIAITGEFQIHEHIFMPTGGPRLNFFTGVSTGYYLCQYCGLATPVGKNCDGCGGGRAPLQDIIKLEQECTWCGSKTINGIVCEQCGTRVAGKTIEETLE